MSNIKTLLNFNSDIVPGRKKEAFSAAGASSGDLYRVDPKKIKTRPGYNPRIETKAWKDGIIELAQSMFTNGFFQHKPLSVVVAVEEGEEVLYLEDGHRRHAAVIYAIDVLGAPIKGVPVVPLDRSLNTRDRLVQLAQANTGEKFTTAELAIFAKRFKAMGDSDEEVAAGLGVSQVYAKQLLTLAGAPTKIWNWVIDETISATHAIETMRKHKEKAVEVLEAALKAKKEKAKGEKAGGDPNEVEASKKTKVTAKDDPEAKRLSAQKRNGPKLFKLVDAMLKDPKVKAEDLGDHYKGLDTLLFEVLGDPSDKPVSTVGDAEEPDNEQ